MLQNLEQFYQQGNITTVRLRINERTKKREWVPMCVIPPKSKDESSSKNRYFFTLIYT